MQFVSLRSFVLLALVCFVLLIAHIKIDASHSHLAAKLTTQPLRRALVRKVLEQDHHFVSANDPRFSYIGRWVSTTNHLRRDASFPGAYVDFVIRNSSSAYLQLRNAKTNQLSDEEEHVSVGSRQLFVLPFSSQVPPSLPVSLLVESHDRPALYFEGSAHGILTLLENQDVPTNASFRITLLSALGKLAPSLEFEGVWLNNGTQLQSASSPTSFELQAASDVPAFQTRLEVIGPASWANKTLCPANYPALLAASFNSLHHHLFLSYCLTQTCQSQVTLSDVYFRSGLPSTPHHSLPYPFPLPQPSVLVLELGLLDYRYFLMAAPATHATTLFNHKFVEAYVSFIKTIRAYAYPHNTRATSTGATLVDPAIGLGANLDYEASFTYNSAPSTLPIFLLTPFTPDKKMRRLLAHLLSETVHRLQKEGDKSTFWLDTTNWLQHDDFAPPTTQNVTYPKYSPALKAAAHQKIASYLSLHLCPYLAEKGTANCPFRKFDNYLGHLYVPDEASMSKLLEERKIALVKDALGLDWGLKPSVSQNER